MAVSKQIYTGTVYNLVQHGSYMNLTFIVNERLYESDFYRK